MDYSVILPAYNEAANISACLKSIKQAGEKAQLLVEIILVDNHSSDNTVSIAKQHGVLVIEGNSLVHRKTIAQLRNEGAHIAKGRILAFLDSDMVVPENWFVAAEQYFNNNFYGLLGFVETVPENAGSVAKAWGDKIFSGEPKHVDFVDGRNMLIPKKLFDEIGGFDQSLTTGEDKEFGLRVNNAGYPVLRASEATLVHLGYERNLLEFIQKEFWRQGSSVLMMLRLGISMRTIRHPMLSIYHLLIPNLLIMTLLSTWSLTLTGLLSIIWFLPSFIIISSKAISGRRHLFLYFWLTFLRWNISGVALLTQFITGNLKKKHGYT